MTINEGVKIINAQTFVLKVYIHCEGCSRKVKKVLQSIEGVYTTTVDAAEQKVTVTGEVASADILVKKLLKAGKHAELWPQKSSNSNNNSNGGSNKGKQQQNEQKSPPPQQGKQQQQQQQKEKKTPKDEDDGDASGKKNKGEGENSGGKKGGKKGGGGGGGEKMKGEEAEESGASGEGSKGGGGGPPAEGGSGGGGKKKKKGGGGGGGGGVGGGGEGMSIIEPNFDADEFPVVGHVVPGGGFSQMPHGGFGHGGFGPGGGGFGPMAAGGVPHMGGGEWPGMAPVSMNRPVVQYVQYVPQYPHVYTQQTGNSADYASHMFNDENTSSCSIM